MKKGNRRKKHHITACQPKNMEGVATVVGLTNHPPFYRLSPRTLHSIYLEAPHQDLRVRGKAVDQDSTD